jgi:hypothetical protein
MNNTLNEYITRSDEILSNTHIHNYNIKLNTKNTNEFKTMIANLENTLLMVKNNYKNFVTNTKNKPKSLDLNLPIIKSNNNIKWMPEINQYSLKINNLVLRGNFANIYNKNMVNNERIQTHQVVPCMEKNECKNILNGEYCKFWHDPMDLLLLKNNNTITESFYNEMIKYTRNFANTSWIYSPDSVPLVGSKNMRLIGSKSQLERDISMIKVSELYRDNMETMKQQVMHDILILLVLSEHGL